MNLFYLDFDIGLFWVILIYNAVEQIVEISMTLNNGFHFNLEDEQYYKHILHRLHNVR